MAWQLPPPHKVKAAQQYLVPKTAKDVSSFLGLASFYSSLDPEFAEIAKAVTELIKKDIQFMWDSRKKAAVDKQRNSMFG
jgi:hypothetical protein